MILRDNASWSIQGHGKSNKLKKKNRLLCLFCSYQGSKIAKPLLVITFKKGQISTIISSTGSFQIWFYQYMQKHEYLKFVAV